MTLFTLSAEMLADFAVFKFFERVYNSQFILFDTDEREICNLPNTKFLQFSLRISLCAYVPIF